MNLLDIPIDIHVDTASAMEAVAYACRDYIKGLTSNPSLMRKQSPWSYEKACRDLLDSSLTKPVSLEVLADHIPEMRRQALKLASWGKNVLVKIPVTLTDGTSTAALVNDLQSSGVNVNVTAVTTAKQVVEVLNIGSRPSIISIFAGRIADSGIDPKSMVRGAVSVCPAGTRILWASTREVLSIVHAAEAGAHIITVPPAILAKAAEKLGRDMTQESLEVVKMFHRDSIAAGYIL